jgi:hypothetical protein
VETVSSLARSRRFQPWVVAGPVRSRPRAPLRLAGPDFAPGPPEPKTFSFFFSLLFFSFSYLYLNILCTKNYQNTF